MLRNCCKKRKWRCSEKVPHSEFVRHSCLQQPLSPTAPFSMPSSQTTPSRSQHTPSRSIPSHLSINSAASASSRKPTPSEERVLADHYGGKRCILTQSTYSDVEWCHIIPPRELTVSTSAMYVISEFDKWRRKKGLFNSAWYLPISVSPHT
jgi:hypothetical protein